MKFLLQIVDGKIQDVEVFNIKLLLDRFGSKYEFGDKYDLIELNDIDNLSDFESASIPIGTLQFVGKFLKKFYNIDNLNPIEVPECLRKEKYLKRRYKIIPKDKLPESGRYFIKYVSKLKEYTFIGDIKDLSDTPSKFHPYKKEGLYQISDIVNILSEYRVFVYQDEIQAIQYYDGNCLIFPDSKLINEMVNMYSLDKDRPRAYTMDIAVINGYETCILELHPLVSVGTYGYDKKELLSMYRLGIDYYININKEIK